MTLELTHEDKEWIKEEVALQIKGQREWLKDWIREEIRIQLSQRN